MQTFQQPWVQSQHRLTKINLRRADKAVLNYEHIEIQATYCRGKSTCTCLQSNGENLPLLPTAKIPKIIVISYYIGEEEARVRQLEMLE
jgi:hypothetical protein